MVPGFSRRSPLWAFPLVQPLLSLHTPYSRRRRPPQQRAAEPQGGRRVFCLFLRRSGNSDDSESRGGIVYESIKALIPGAPKLTRRKNKALGRSAPSRCSSMNYGLFIKTLGPHGAPRVPWDPRRSKFGLRPPAWPKFWSPPGPNFECEGAERPSAFFSVWLILARLAEDI